jgi:hypothetical protein
VRREVTELWVLGIDDCEYLRGLAMSMPRRLAEVISRGGNPTKY